MVSVLIVDDHQLVRQGLCALLGNVPGIDIVGEARNGEEAVKADCELSPDVILMDVEMPRLNGLQAARKILEGGSRARILMLSMRTDAKSVRGAAQSGCKGYLLKDCSRDELINSICSVCEGREVCSPSLAEYWSSD